MRQIKVKGLPPDKYSTGALAIAGNVNRGGFPVPRMLQCSVDHLVGATVLRAHPPLICAAYLPRVVSWGSAAAAFWAASRLTTSS
jgi:hypothetical protein